MAFPENKLKLKSYQQHVSVYFENHLSNKQAKEIASLFREQFGSQYPFKKVTQAEFWLPKNKKSEAYSGSFLAYAGNELVAQLHCRWQKNRETALILLHCFSKECLSKTQEIKDQIFEEIYHWSARENINNIIEVILASEPIFLLNDKSKLKGDEIALVSAYGKTTHHNLLLRLHQPEVVNAGKRQIYLPRKDEKIIREIYQNAKIKRNFLDPFSKQKKSIENRDQDNHGFSLEEIAELGILKMIIQPSKLKSWSTLLNKIIRTDESIRKNASLLLYLDASDSASMELIEILESFHFSFSGIIPSSKTSDYLLYSRTDKAMNNLTIFANPFTRKLRDTIEKQRK